MQLNPLKIAVIPALLATPMLTTGLYAAVNSTVTYDMALGKSSNPAPSSLGMPLTPSAMPSATMVGANGSQMNGNAKQEYRRAALPFTNVASPAWAQQPLKSATSVLLRPFASNLFEGRFAAFLTLNTKNRHVHGWTQQLNAPSHKGKRNRKTHKA